MNPSEAAGGALATPASVRKAQHRAAKEFGQRLGRARLDKGAPVRTVFAADPTVEKTPLVRLLSGENGPGGGRGGQVRLKLLLSLYWVSVAAPYDTTFPARAWSALLGLDDPEVKGVRRIHQAIGDLEARRFISVEDRGGRPSRLTLLNESGDGTPFEVASESYNRARAAKASTATLAKHQYFRIPSEVWTAGHIAQLTGPAVAMMLVILAEQRGTDEEVWFSPGRAEERYGLAPTTITKGLRSLREQNLLKSRRTSVSDRGTYIDFARYRNVHALTITQKPSKPAPPSPGPPSQSVVDLIQRIGGRIRPDAVKPGGDTVSP